MILGRDITLIVVCYCLGCFTSGYYWVRWRTGLDVREHGSGTVGARNVGRLLGPTSFVVTLLLDFTKGALAVWLAMKTNSDPQTTVVAMAAVVAGHTWPVQLRFRGGKGVATSLGAILAFDPLLALTLVVVFLPCFALLRNFTLGGLLAFVLTPLAAFFTGLGYVEVAAASLLALIILVAHRKNIRQEIAGISGARPLKENPMHGDKGRKL
jgi:glycerol-3-phosphate acyltransferase PlsY